MAAASAVAPRSSTRARPRAASPSPRSSLALRLLSFFALACASSLAYATLVRHPPAARVLALAAIATAGGAALALSARRAGSPSPGRGSAAHRATALRSLLAALPSPRWALPVLRCALVAGMLALGLAVLGVPLHLLAPARWAELAGDLQRGLHGLRSWTWPYSGRSHWARLAVLMLLSPWMSAAAAVSFWPSQRALAGRSVLVFAMAITVMVAGLANAPAAAWRAQGALLALLTFAWFWLPTLRALDGARAIGWASACLAGALIAAPALSSSSAWLALGARSGAVGSATQFQWDQLYGPIEWPRSREEMFSVATAHDDLLRVTSLDRFDGLRFIRSDSPPQTDALDLRTASTHRAALESAAITIAHLRSSEIVGGEGLTTRLQWTDASAHVQRSASDGSITAAGPLASGTRYTVLSYAPSPTPAQLRRATRALPGAYVPYTEFELPAAGASALQRPALEREARSPALRSQLVRAPALRADSERTRSVIVQRILASPYGPMYELARRLAAGASSAYGVALRIERYLRANYTYDEHPPLRRYRWRRCLFEDRRGYCEQFSGAMTLMLRMDAIPARVGAGFKPTLTEAGGAASRVTALDAHTWVEILFPGIGWVSFDPTPAASQRSLANTPATSKSKLVGAPAARAPRAARSAAEKTAHDAPARQRGRFQSSMRARSRSSR